ncbi:hypothetical protein [Arthrobacter globiformis]|uniref:hypothetical protein n=1 Tax=Arthrobacter globiformis TaxID=1665 RepID=UPI00278DFFA1|nr:hypothetical protein [Arthrobacter globiformis]MDQ0616648.1 hypothetical protein [Arthrobacter globiformis]
MKKKTIAAGGLILGIGVALAAAAIPATPVTPSAEPVAGIIRQAEAYAHADPVAEQGMQEAVRQCMAKAGFDYTPPKWASPLDLNGFIGFKRLSVETAKTSGYASTEPQGPHEPTPGSADGQLFADPAFNDALTGPAGTQLKTTADGLGTSAGGCRGQAMTRIYGSAENYMLATLGASNSLLIATNSASSDPGVDRTIKDWKACMNETPHSSYANPQQASDAGKAAGGQEEFRIAVADAVCRDKTGFHATLDSILDKYLTTRMQQLAPEIERVKEIRRIAASNAGPILATTTN